jgi:hypothetical protein
VLVDNNVDVCVDGPVHTLSIRRAAWNQAGEYKCVADGGATSSGTLTVKGNAVRTIDWRIRR